MAEDRDDPVWDAFVTAMLAAGPAQERKSRFADKPALFAGRRQRMTMSDRPSAAWACSA
jgi:hypothetical protein